MGPVKCPVAVSQIPIVERRNNLRISVYELEQNTLFPLHISKQNNVDCINLLLISEENNQHYCLIRNMSRLLGDETKHNGQCFPCLRCLHRYSTQDLLDAHLSYCSKVSPQHVVIPSKENNIMKFKNVNYQHSVLYTAYADFQPILIPQVIQSQKNTEKLTKHKAFGHSFIIIGPNGRSLKPVNKYRSPYAATHFIKNLLKEVIELILKILEIKPLKMTSRQEEFKSVTHCSVCHNP